MADAQARLDKVLLGITPKGKKIYYARKPLKTMRFIAFGDGGKLPHILEGGFSSCKAAQTVVDSYLAGLKNGDIDVRGNKKAKPKVKAT